MNDLELLIKLHNDIRKDNSWMIKLLPLDTDKSLMRYAKNHAKHMLKSKRIVHSEIKDILKLGFNIAGENIAWGQPDANSVMKTWMLSNKNRANILRFNYTKIGCYAEPDAYGKLYWCVVFAS